MQEVKTPGLIAVRAVITDADSGKSLGVGHGTAILTRTFKMHDRLLGYCFNGALLSGMNNACKSLDALRLEANTEGAPPVASESSSFEPATEKQRHYLAELIALNVQDEDEREQRQAQIGELTKSEASRMIESFRR